MLSTSKNTSAQRLVRSCGRSDTATFCGVPSVSTSSRPPPPQVRRTRDLLRASGNLNHRFDAAGLRFQIRGEIFDDAVEVRPVGDPRVGVDLPLLDHLDDLLQLLPRGVPGAQDRQLAAVEVRVVEADVKLAE